jgi:hypothetical protein
MDLEFVPESPEARLDPVQKIYVYLSYDKDGKEGLCAFFNEERAQWFPMVAADPRQAEKMRSLAADMAAKSDMRVVLVEFSCRRDLTTWPARVK